jgi:hypothetical protein
MQTGKGKAREYKVLLGAISVIVGLASFYVLAVSSYGILKGLASFPEGDTNTMA